VTCKFIACGFKACGSVAYRYIGCGYTVYKSRVVFSEGLISISLGNKVVV
jgi:hypothetical protein